MSQPNRHRSAFNLQEASFPWQQYFRGIFGTLLPKGPCAHDARAATSALAPGPGCRQARSALHHQAGNELLARQGLGENPGCLLGAAPVLGQGGQGGGAFFERDEGCSGVAQPMRWLGSVAMATVVRQSREGGCWDTRGCRAPPPSAGLPGPGARDRQGTGAGRTAAAGASSFSWETHGHNLFKCFLR